MNRNPVTKEFKSYSLPRASWHPWKTSGTGSGHFDRPHLASVYWSNHWQRPKGNWKGIIGNIKRWWLRWCKQRALNNTMRKFLTSPEKLVTMIPGPVQRKIVPNLNRKWIQPSRKQRTSLTIILQAEPSVLSSVSNWKTHCCLFEKSRLLPLINLSVFSNIMQIHNSGFGRYGQYKQVYKRKKVEGTHMK